MKFSNTITGLDRLDKTFANMPRSSQRKAYIPALRAGGKVLKDASTANIRQVSDKYTGVLALKSSIAVYNAKKLRGNYRVLVHVRRGLINTRVSAFGKKPVRVGLYASVLEYGSQKLNRKPRSWIRKAKREKEGAAQNKIRQEFSARVSQIVADARR